LIKEVIRDVNHTWKKYDGNEISYKYAAYYIVIHDKKKFKW